jgi:hypothetical protein
MGFPDGLSDKIRVLVGPEERVHACLVELVAGSRSAWQRWGAAALSAVFCGTKSGPATTCVVGSDRRQISA